MFFSSFLFRLPTLFEVGLCSLKPPLSPCLSPLNLILITVYFKTYPEHCLPAPNSFFFNHIFVHRRKEIGPLVSAYFGKMPKDNQTFFVVSTKQHVVCIISFHHVHTYTLRHFQSLQWAGKNNECPNTNSQM